MRAKPVAVNPIHRSKADYVVAMADHRDSVRQAAFHQLADLMSRLPPEAILSFIPELVEMTDIPGKDRLVAIARQLTGQVDPDAQYTPEGQAMLKEREMKQEKQEQLEEAERAAEVEKKQADTRAKQADALAKTVTALKDSLELVQNMGDSTELAPMIEAVINASNQITREFDL